MSDAIKDAPLPAELRTGMIAAMKALEAKFPKGAGLALLVFDMQRPEGSRASFISNCNRADMIAAMKELLARWEGQPRQTGKA